MLTTCLRKRLVENFKVFVNVFRATQCSIWHLLDVTFQVTIWMIPDWWGKSCSLNDPREKVHQRGNNAYREFWSNDESMGSPISSEIALTNINLFFLQ